MNDSIPHGDWPQIAAWLPLPWPRAAAEHDLRWYAAEVVATGGKARWPGRPALMLRWGWTDHAVRGLLSRRMLP